MTPDEEKELAKLYGKDDGFTDKSFKGTWFAFKGRLNRMRYLLRALPVILLGMAVASVATGDLLWLGVLLFPLLYSKLSLVSRRAHDIGYRAWLLMILSVLPFFDLVTFAYLCLAKGDKGPNKFGPDPLEYPYDIR